MRVVFFSLITLLSSVYAQQLISDNGVCYRLDDNSVRVIEDCPISDNGVCYKLDDNGGRVIEDCPVSSVSQLPSPSSLPDDKNSKSNSTSTSTLNAAYSNNVGLTSFVIGGIMMFL